MATWGSGTGKWGTITGWALNNTASPETNKRETAHSKTNNAIASKLYDKRIEISETYNATQKATAPAIPANIGLLNDLPMTNLQINTFQDNFAQMVIAGHEHVDGTDNGAVRSVAHGITIERAFGVSMFGFTQVDEPTESSVTVECDHAETPAGGAEAASGNTGAGENHNPRITLSITAHDGYASPPSGFEVQEKRPGTDAEGFATYTTVAVKDLAFAE